MQFFRNEKGKKRRGGEVELTNRNKFLRLRVNFVGDIFLMERVTSEWDSYRWHNSSFFFNRLWFHICSSFRCTIVSMVWNFQNRHCGNNSHIRWRLIETAAAKRPCFNLPTRRALTEVALWYIPKVYLIQILYTTVAYFSTTDVSWIICLIYELSASHCFSYVYRNAMQVAYVEFQQTITTTTRAYRTGHTSHSNVSLYLCPSPRTGR